MSTFPTPSVQSVDDAVKFYETIMDALDESFAVVDREATILAINKAGIPDGTDKQESIGVKFFVRFPHLIKEGWHERIERVFISGEPCIEPYTRHMNYEGETRYCNLKFLPIRHDGGVAAVLIVVANVNEERLAKLHAKDVEFRYQQIVETMRLVSFRLDASGKFTFLNTAAFDVFGLAPGEMLGNPFSQYVQTEDVGKFWRVFWEVVNHDRKYGIVENRITAADNTSKHMRWNFHPVYDREGKIIGCQGVGEDISEQHQYLSYVEQSRAKYRGLFNTVLSPLLIVNTEARIVNVNRAACRFLRCSQQELVNRLVHDLVPSGHRSSFEEIWVRLQQKGRTQDKIMLKRPDNSMVPVTASGTRFGKYMALTFSDRRS